MRLSSFQIESVSTTAMHTVRPGRRPGRTRELDRRGQLGVVVRHPAAGREQGHRGDGPVERIRHDLHYIEHWNLWLDLRAMILTFFKRQGAC